MASFVVCFLVVVSLFRLAAAGIVFTDVISLNFSASSNNYIDKNGVFLNSISSTFSAVFYAANPQSPFVVSVVHSPTSTIVWSANRNSPAPYTAELTLTVSGLSISSNNGSVLWSTPQLPRPVALLRLLDSGNLLLLDAANNSLWQSFEYPTDTLLSSQILPAGGFLSTLADDYRLVVTDRDAFLLWSAAGNQQFWSLSSDPSSITDLNAAVAYMEANDSGLYLFSSGGKVVIELTLPSTKLRIMKLEPDGNFRIMSYSGSGSTLNQVFVAPSSGCNLPTSCNELEVCTIQTQSAANCNCPPSFIIVSGGGCAPADGSVLFSLSSCGTNGTQEISYQSLRSGIGYFANKFASPAMSGGNFSSCRGLCDSNCSCLGFFYQNSSESCFLIKQQLGSLVNSSNNGVFDAGIGYIKVLLSSQPPPGPGGKSSSPSDLLPILLPCIAVFLLILVLLFVGAQWWRRQHSSARQSQLRSTTSPKPSGMKDIYLGRNPPWPSPANDPESAFNGSDSDSDEISIPGLPTRFAYADLVAATNNFNTKIGSGGFGEVFKGVLPDNSQVAVKRIAASVGGSVHGKKEFCTEIAVIGNIHHINLVRLRGYCAEGRRRLLVYEYMNRSSLDRSIFASSGAPVLEWGERMGIAICAARGLSYLHSGCDRTIIHCDVKPENILLHDGGAVKIADFGLAKLLSPEQSGLFTTMRGTRGYLAPEWLTNSPISDRTDVYSYGMVLLEIIRGRKNSGGGGGGVSSSSSSGSGGDNGYFPLVALDMHEAGRYAELADPRLEGRVTEEEVGRAVKVALCCLHEEPAQRPTMAAVAAMLDGTMEVPRPRPDSLGFLRLYGRGFVNYDVGSITGEFAAGTATGTTTSSSLISYSCITSHEVSWPR